MTRRKFTMMAGATVLAGWQASSSQAKSGEISLVLAPSNLGLRPTESGGQPGTWRAPQVLIDAGLARALGAEEIIPLERPTYQFEAQSGTRIRNGLSIRAFSLQLSEKVHEILQGHRFPVVIGGDCSILVGCLHGMRRAGGRGAHQAAPQRRGHEYRSTAPRQPDSCCRVARLASAAVSPPSFRRSGLP